MKKSGIGLQRYQGFTSVLCLILLMYLTTLGMLQTYRMQQIEKLCQKMNTFERYTYTKSRIIYDIKKAMRENDSTLQSTYDCDAFINIEYDTAYVFMKLDGYTWDFSIVYDKNRNIFEEK